MFILFWDALYAKKYNNSVETINRKYKISSSRFHIKSIDWWIEIENRYLVGRRLNNRHKAEG